MLRLTKSTTDNAKNNQNSEDSEWIDFSEKPNLVDFAFKDFGDPDDEIQEEDKNSKEPVKTWNTTEKVRSFY